MTFRYTHTRLLVQDFAACFRFYCDVLGFAPRYGDQRGPYAEFKLDGITLALYQRELMADALEAPMPASAAGADEVVLCMQVDDVDAAYEALHAKGVRFIAGPTDRPNWRIRTAHLRDPDGNLIEINSPRK
jgi:catechol 2,3-dioxygenase-like lactoylglutathione lyase family enzyme